jgi:DNA-binding SARP family transcriptional activator
MEEQLQIRTLGTLEFHQSGSIVTDFPSRKAEALLVYLAVERNIAHRRETLFTLLWPGMPEKSARHNLRQVLYTLRQMFPEADNRRGGEPVPVILADRQTIQVNPDAEVLVDLHQMEDLLASSKVHDHLNLAGCQTCIQAIEKAADLYGGFLPGRQQ